MKRHLLGLLALLLFISCSTSDDEGTINIIAGCGVSNVAADLDWLQQEISERENSSVAEMKYCYILTATLNEETVFIYGDCNPLVDKIFFVLDCEGSILNPVEASETFPFTDITNRQLLWKPADFECNLEL